MKTILILVACMFMIPAACMGESWEDFQKAKIDAETPDLAPKQKADLIPKTVIVERIRKRGQIDFSADTLQFDYGAWKLREASTKQLKEIAAALKEPALAAIPFFYVDGHTCNIGSDDNNCILSSRRANSVVRYLVEHGGVPVNRVVPRGFGKSNPAASNDTEEGRRQNRRVVLKRGVAEKETESSKVCP